MSRKRTRRQRDGKRRGRGWLVAGAGALFVPLMVGVSLFTTGLLGSQEASAEQAADIISRSMDNKVSYHSGEEEGTP